MESESGTEPEARHPALCPLYQFYCFLLLSFSKRMLRHRGTEASSGSLDR